MACIVATQGPVRPRAGAHLGGSPRGYVSYFASDTTPLFILLVAEYARLRPDILSRRIERRDGSVITVAGAARQAAALIESHLTPDGLVEVTRHNFLSLPHQTWRDGPTSNFDELGHMPNVAEPIAYLDIQALSADALDAMAALVREGLPSTELPIGEQPSNDIAWSQVLEENARAIRSATQRKFWLADAGYYAFALDRDAHGRRRVLRAAQSNAGWLLATRFFDDLPPDEREQGTRGSCGLCSRRRSSPRPASADVR